MKNIFGIVLILIFISPLAHAKTSWQTNKLRKKAQSDAYWEQVDSIPLYTDKLTGEYDIISAVRGQDMLSTKKEYAWRQMREQAHKAGADAVMEVECRTEVKKLFVNCEGFAIKYRK